MSKTRVVRKNLSYAVDNSLSVELVVTVGDTQAGGGSTMWDKSHAVVIPGEPVTIAGNGPLKGTEIRLVMSVKDVATAHDHTSITVSLAGGISPTSTTYQADASEPGGEVVYIIAISLV